MHLPGAGSPAGVLQPLLAGRSGTAVSPPLSGWPARRESCSPSPAPQPWFPGTGFPSPPALPISPYHLIGVEVRAIARQSLPRENGGSPATAPDQASADIPSPPRPGAPGRCPRLRSAVLSASASTGPGRRQRFRRCCYPPVPFGHADAHREMVRGSRSRASAVADTVLPWASSEMAYARSRGVGARIIRRSKSLTSICHCSRNRSISLTPITNPSLTPDSPIRFLHKFTPTIPSTTCRCWNGSRALWTRPLHCRGGSFPRSSACCAGCWSPGWDGGVSGSMYRCSGCWRPSHSRVWLRR